MTNDITKKDQNLPTNIDDGFETWDDSIEGSDRPLNAGLIKGSLDKFGNDGIWQTRDGDPIDTTIERLGYELQRVVQKWGPDHKPVITTFLGPGEKFPDLEERNNQIPRKDWIDGPNGLTGPWQKENVFYSVDLKTMSKFTFLTHTIGGGIAIRDFRDKIVLMRKVRGQGVFPIIKLSRVWWNVRGGRWRPHFEIVRWVRLGADGGSEVEALPKPKASPAVTAEVATVEKTPLEEVKEPPLAEEMNDAIPDFGETKPASVRSTARRDLKPTAKTKATPSRRRVSNLDAG
jgi:hypothetical protein